MKLLYIKNYIHHKNGHFILNCKNINITTISHTIFEQYISNDIINLNEYDCIFSPSYIFDMNKYEHITKPKFIFGPHLSVFPDSDMLSRLISKNNNIYINTLSNWNKNSWMRYDICKYLQLIELPFGVDTTLFNELYPIEQRQYVVIYFKHRQQEDYNFVYDFLIQKNISSDIIRTFDYFNRYNENEFIQTLHNAKYCIVIDAHESQGFALQEMMSCNVPLLVWNIQSMKDESITNYDDIPATSIPYWDDKCGEVFYNKNELENKFELLQNKLTTYEPRKFILDNLSIETCEKKWIDFIQS